MGCDSDGNSIGPMKLNNDKLQVWTPSNNHLHLSYASSNFYADDLLPSWIVMRRGNPISIEVCRSFLPRKGIDIAYVMECGESVLLIIIKIRQVGGPGNWNLHRLRDVPH